MITDNFYMLDHFHKTLKKLLQGANLSVLSRDLGIPRSVLQDWIHGNRSPSMKNINHVKKLADHLSLSLDELLIGKDSERRVISAVTFEDEKRVFRINIERLK